MSLWAIFHGSSSMDSEEEGEVGNVSKVREEKAKGKMEKPLASGVAKN